MESRLPKFLATETREEFKRKQMESKSYATRTKLEKEEEADDLYMCCETPLKKKLITSMKIEDDPKKTSPEVMLKELERMCLPKINIVVERQEFQRNKARRSLLMTMNPE